jgi:NAD(P)H-flavin reductase
MATANFKLLSKEKLTYDVFKMVFESDIDLSSISGQFLTFLLPKT